MARYFAIAAVVVTCCAMFGAMPARAWVLHEHVRIGYEAVRLLELDPARDTLQRAWNEARGQSRASQARLCADLGVGPDPYVAPNRAQPEARCIPFAALPALAGDHSCTTRGLGADLLTSDWVPEVLEVANGSVRDLGPDVTDTASRIDAWHEQHVELQLQDDEYLARAAINNAHFLLDRRAGTLTEYLERALGPGELLNATSLYVAYHVTALSFARRVTTECARSSDPTCRGRLSWRAFLAEAHALHFLEDSFSAGHFIGTWGDQASRKGTHDHYCRVGVEAELWRRSEDDGYHAFGDAFLSPEDSAHAARAVAQSLMQLASALTDARDFSPEDLALIERATPYDGVNLCTSTHVPLALDTFAPTAFIREVLTLTPMPGRRVPSLPRFRDEIGLFFLASVRVDGDLYLWGPRQAWDFHGGAQGRVGVGFGYAAEDVLTRYSDRSFAAEGVIASSIESDARATLGLGGHVRLPFGVLAPVDLVYWLIASSRQTSVGRRFLRGAFSAAQGGVLGRLERVHVLGPDATVQFFLGRELTVLHYWHPDGDARGDHRWEFLFPFLNLVFERIPTGRLASDYGLELAGILSVAPNETRFGLTLTFAARARRYF